MWYKGLLGLLTIFVLVGGADAGTFRAVWESPTLFCMARDITTAWEGHQIAPLPIAEQFIDTQEILFSVMGSNECDLLNFVAKF